MKGTFILALGVCLVLLSGCSADAPPAPIGFGKKPANSPETVTRLTGTGEHTPSAAIPVAQVSAGNPQESGREVHSAAEPSAATIVLSDNTAPGGIESLSERDRVRLITAAKSAQSVVLLCRGDGAVHSRRNWDQMVRRGARVKVFLVNNGVDPRHVRLFVRSTGAFVANNKTAAGRAKNRRVEIHFG